MTPEQRSERARIAARTQWANTADRTARTEALRAGLQAKWEREARQIHPDGDDRTIALAAEALMHAHYARARLAKSKKAGAKKTPNK